MRKGHVDVHTAYWWQGRRIRLFRETISACSKALITGLLGSSLNHPNKSFTGDIVDFETPTQSSLPSDFSISEDEMIRSIRQGKMDQYLDSIIGTAKRDWEVEFSHFRLPPRCERTAE